MSNTNLDNVVGSAQMFENDSNLVDVILDFSNAMSVGFGMYQYCSNIVILQTDINNYLVSYLKT